VATQPYVKQMSREVQKRSHEHTYQGGYKAFGAQHRGHQHSSQADLKSANVMQKMEVVWREAGDR
jgi:hypothetical protein